MDWRQFGINSIPTATAAAASLAVPEVGLPMWLAMLLRGSAGAAGSVPGTVLRRGIEQNLGQQVPPLASDLQGEAAAQFLGTIIPTGAGRIAENIGNRAAMDAWSPGAIIQSEYQNAAKRAAAAGVGGFKPEMTQQITKMRLKLGGPANKTAQASLEKQMAPFEAERNQFLTEQAAHGITYSPMDPALADAISALKQELRSERDPASSVATVDKMWREFINARRVKGKLVRLSPHELDEVKQTAYDRAQQVFDAIDKEGAGGFVPTTSQMLEARVNRAIGAGAKAALERHSPGLRGVNAQLGPLYPIRQLVNKREMAPPPKIPLTAPWRGLESPSSRSALSLLLTDPRLQALIQGLPRAAVPGLETMSGWPVIPPGMFPYAPPDSTR